MSPSSQTERRKGDHLRIVLQEDVRAKNITTGFERLLLPHCALPELDARQIDMTVSVWGRSLRAPFLISSMTGGTTEAGEINRRLAEAAQQLGIGMGLGSQRAAIEDPTLAPTYQVRTVAPNILLLANIGAVQLNYGFGPDECRRAVEMIEADGLILHFNALQEAVQPRGDTNFVGLLRKVEEVCHSLPVPVVAKEVGNGIGGEVARQLADAGVAAIDVAGAGGTSWSEVESHRQEDSHGVAVARAFAGWGIPTAEAIRQVREALPDILLIGSGGIRSGVDAAKAIALGANLVGAAAPMLPPATDLAKAVIERYGVYIEQLRVAMFCVGAGDLAALRKTPLRPIGGTQ